MAWDGLKDPDTYTTEDRAALAAEAIRWINRFRYVQSHYNSDDMEQGLLTGAIVIINSVALSNRLAVNSAECAGCECTATEFDDVGTPLCIGCAWETAKGAAEYEDDKP